MIPTSFELASFSSYYTAKGEDILQAIQSYCLDIYKNIHSKGLCFSSCGVSEAGIEERPFFAIFSVEKQITAADIFLPLQVTEPEKTPPEVIEEDYYAGVLSDSWLIGINIVQTLLSPEDFNSILKEKDDKPLFVNFYMQLTLRKKEIDMKSLLIINKLLRRDRKTRYTVESVLKGFFGYSTSPSYTTVIEYPRKYYYYPDIKQQLEKFFDINAFIEYALVPNLDPRLQVFIEENCVVPFFVSISGENTYKILFGTDSLFFVKFFVFLKTCATYFEIMTGKLHPKRNEKAIQDNYKIETGVGFIERGKCSTFDLYRDVGITLFGLIHKGLMMD